MEMIERELEEILTEDSEGLPVKIVHLQQFYDMTAMMDTAKKWLPGIHRYETKNQIPVNQIDEDTFEIVSSGVRVKRVKS